MGSQLAFNKAKRHYVIALGLISEAVETPEIASRDATLLASLLLDLFEKMTNRVQYSKDAWVSHVKGALSLVQLRGRDQFQSSLGIQLLVRLCNNLLISCVVSHQPLPSEFMALRTAVENHVDSNNPKWRLGGLMVDFVELRQAAEDQAIDSYEIMQLAKWLDDDFSALADNMPPSWQYERVSTGVHSPRVYGNSYHIYRDVHVTQTWNVLRLTRILINEIILDQRVHFLANPPSFSTPSHLTKDWEAAEQSTNRLINDICGSVPQYTGLDTITLTKYHANPREQIRMSCYTLLFPLFVAAQSTWTAPCIREWIMVQLRHMSREINVRNAELILTVLKRGEWVEPWSVYVMLGGYAFVA